ncbi:MAG: hypothetical protein ACJAYU_000431 [Bradymonadia bacterium]
MFLKRLYALSLLAGLCIAPRLASSQDAPDSAVEADTDADPVTEELRPRVDVSAGPDSGSEDSELEDSADDEFDWDSLDSPSDDGADGDSSDEFDWDSLDSSSDDGADGDSSDEFDWDSLDSASDDGADGDSADEFDWDSLDSASDDGADGPYSDSSDSSDSAPGDGDEFDWDSLESEEATTDWDALWDEIDESTEEIEEVVVPVEIGETVSGVQGVVFDDDVDVPVMGADVTLDGDHVDLEMRTPASGTFFFEVAPGTYILRVNHMELDGVSYEVLAEPGEITEMGLIRMRPSNNQVTIVVEGRAVQESTATQLRERQESTTVQDAISAEQISQSGDSSAASAVTRVVGVTLIDDRFLVVRGLEGRYNNVTLNGVPVPRTDPDYPSVEVDIFPAALLSSLTLTKNPTAELLSFTGGLMDVQTRAFPEEFELKISASLGGDTATTFQSFHRVPGGSVDALGFDDGTRALPEGLPTDETVDRRRTDDYESLARQFPDQWDPATQTARPDLGLRLSVGDTFELGERDLGVLFMAGYSNGLERREGVVRSANLADGELVEVESLDGESFTTKATWGALANLSLELADSHDLRLVTMWNHQARDRYSEWTGLSDEEGGDLVRSSRQWLQRTLLFNQLLGSHRQLLTEESPFHETRIDWALSISTAQRLEPDTRFHKTVDGRWTQNPGTGEHFTSELNQTDLFAKLSLELPYLDAFSATLSGDVFSGHREFDTRRFRYQLGSDADPGLRSLGPEEAFGDENLTQDGGQIVLREWTGSGDGYVSDQLAVSGGLSLEASPFDWLRLVAGARVESFTQEIADQAVGVDDPESSRRTDFDVLPSAGAIIELRESMYLRLLYGASVARPQVREVAPFVYQDYLRRRTVTGNPDLRRIYVHNADLRWELFPSPAEVIAVSAFYKDFRSPIESTLVNRQGDVIYLNAESASNFGVELEAQVDLGRIGERADGLTLGVNTALIASSIELPCPDDNGDGECDFAYTRQSRPMQGQAPWQVNARLSWDRDDSIFNAALLYGVIGPRIDDVGTNGQPDYTLEARHVVDITTGLDLGEHWSLGLKLRNLLFANERITQGDVVVREVFEPMEFGISFGWRD